MQTGTVVIIIQQCTLESTFRTQNSTIDEIMKFANTSNNLLKILYYVKSLFFVHLKYSINNL
jgi:hypothetical protein